MIPHGGIFLSWRPSTSGSRQNESPPTAGGMKKMFEDTRVLYQRLLRTINGSLSFLNAPHFRINKEDGSLILYEYKESDQLLESPIIGTAFFLTFFPIWFLSLVTIPVSLYLTFRGNWTHLTCLLFLSLYTYLPIPKRSAIFRLFMFVNVPKYFKQSSFRIVSPHKFPEYKLLVSSLQEEKTKESQYPPWHIVTLSKHLKLLNLPCRIWLFHPHGLLCNGWGLQAFNPYLPQNEMCISTALYYMPPVICYTSHCGKPSPVSARVVKAHLAARRSVTIVLGGFEEAAIHPNEGDRLYIRNRKGIFKYALQYGCEIVPVFVFGESQAYRNVQGLWGMRLWLTKRGIPAMLPWGRTLGFMPKNLMLHVVVGDPIPVEMKAEIRAEVIDELHSRYMRALEDLYDSWKCKFFGPEYKRKLELW
eukprot:Gregarina_sp_Poly_1__5801@NODE_3052_length_1425_cov_146_290869_g1933_i0_p1_GENE_NODE_3052_length_1425_cov_146_290869_g1933_i0NODE_3052_length_1425_cov_146_290869_g1933_i0_p1_ORF_typecomplete_len418_score25_01DAGAT/PF03982_13/4_5e41_NODE_3052_length_1425_cov_146_290869_g1933_i01391392